MSKNPTLVMKQIITCTLLFLLFGGNTKGQTAEDFEQSTKIEAENNPPAKTVTPADSGNKHSYAFSKINTHFNYEIAAPNYVSTASNYHFDFSRKQLIAPASLILAGLLSNGKSPESIKSEVVEERNEHIPKFRTHLDDYLQFSPLLAVYGLDALGIKSKNDLRNRSLILLKGEFIMFSTTTLLKKLTHTLRPDGSAHNSFPSGHTAQAFTAATFLSEEYKSRYPWMPYASYTVASSVGLLRVANNRHYISDVLVGAGIGYLAMKTAYWTHHRWERKRHHSNVVATT